MFGIYRTFLAVAVVASHLALIPFIGGFAVSGFFVLSGYLMTLVMQRSYGYSVWGFSSFVANRALRLYPSYWASIILAVASIYMVGSDVSSAFHDAIRVPESSSEWFQNISMLYFGVFPNEISPRISPATWALTVEIVFYVAIGAGLMRSSAISGIVLAFGASWHIFAVVSDLDLTWRYHFIPAAALPFSLGALAFHCRYGVMKVFRTARIAFIIGVFFFLASLLLELYSKIVDSHLLSTFPAYGNLISSVLTVSGLASLRPSSRVREIDRFFGDFSYHIYVLHWTVGLLFAHYFFDLKEPSRSGSGFALALVTVATCVLLSIGLTKLVDGPIDHFRRTIRERQILRSNALASSSLEPEESSSAILGGQR